MIRTRGLSYRYAKGGTRTAILGHLVAVERCDNCGGFAGNVHKNG